ncbi:hypothetical protein HYPSUDRAFT_417278 [Hypholoma sublateritium FD-334 SS-4]|uniref:Uncharacterized protein n=1 Tax=Hypholoma sublateritium (strain FD-334 SS-4) TaxID=945553 RepID=A0A0D2LVA9_HYPSF|nr:hypothetical protein HYPSUDRAFT_417278 [Hypholoma sublateritium FD-334 SS-4]
MDEERQVEFMRKIHRSRDTAWNHERASAQRKRPDKRNTRIRTRKAEPTAYGGANPYPHRRRSPSSSNLPITSSEPWLAPTSLAPNMLELVDVRLARAGNPSPSPGATYAEECSSPRSANAPRLGKAAPSRMPAGIVTGPGPGLRGGAGAVGLSGAAVEAVAVAVDPEVERCESLRRLTAVAGAASPVRLASCSLVTVLGKSAAATRVFFRRTLPSPMPSRLRWNASFMCRSRSSISCSLVNIGPRWGDVDRKYAACGASVVGEATGGDMASGDVTNLFPGSGDDGPSSGDDMYPASPVASYARPLPLRAPPAKSAACNVCWRSRRSFVRPLSGLRSSMSCTKTLISLSSLGMCVLVCGLSLEPNA